MVAVPEIRIQKVNDVPPRMEGDFVLYWMIANRRVTWNYSLQRAIEWAQELKKPLVILEALRTGYQWASDRLHQFIIDGMRDNVAALKSAPVTCYPYLEPDTDSGKGLLAALADRACVIVTDDFPAFMLPRMVAAAGRQVSVQMEKVDSNGILPMRTADRVFTTAYSFRRFLQKTLPEWLQTDNFPAGNPFQDVELPVLESLPSDIIDRWPVADLSAVDLSPFPIDHTVPPVDYRGGTSSAVETMQDFVKNRLSNYSDGRNDPGENGSSGLSPYLHFGHIAAHQVFQEIAFQEDWSPDHLSAETKGKRSGWWGISESAEAFLDELITWREVGFNMCWQRDDYAEFDSLPDWAKETLADHADDPRDYVYDLTTFENAQTHDPLWNAAQMQLVQEGRIHNYLRMLWGKKILHWTKSPQDALEIMIELNNKYAVDGRDPNSYSGIFWVLGRYDRAWGPERPIFGKVRYMTSRSTARKYHVDDYIKKYTGE